MSGKMHIYDRRGHAFKSWVAITPLIGATLIAVSRTMDYRHHATDVIAGGLLGTVIAVFTYHLCASLSLSVLSPALPFSPRIPATPTGDRLDSDADDDHETAPRPGAAGAPRSGNGGGGAGGGILPTHRYSASLDSEQGTSPLSQGSAIPLQGGARGDEALRPGFASGPSTKSAAFEVGQQGRY